MFIFLFFLRRREVSQSRERCEYKLERVWQKSCLHLSFRYFSVRIIRSITKHVRSYWLCLFVEAVRSVSAFERVGDDVHSPSSSYLIIPDKSPYNTDDFTTTEPISLTALVYDVEVQTRFTLHFTVGRWLEIRFVKNDCQWNCAASRKHVTCL